MKIVLAGAGSGGHITPILAVAREFKQLQPDIQLIYIGQRGDQLSDVPAKSPFIDEVYTVRAGKFRRYHGAGAKQLFDVLTLAKNFRDAWRVLIGTWQSYWLLGKIKPDIIFIKGGFVGVPIGLAAAKRHIPFVTHDSDAIPGLANRIIARWAALHTVGLPKEVYAYPQDKTVTVGVPVQAEFRPVTPEKQEKYKKQVGLGHAKQVIFITGGGNGARSLNDAVAECMPALLKSYPDTVIVHVAGRKLEEKLTHQYDKLLEPHKRKQVIVKGFVDELYAYSGAADVVITRAGATTLAEFAVQRKACIVVPNPMLTGGHQLKNAQFLSDQHATICVTERQLHDGSGMLELAIRHLLDEPKERQVMAKRFSSFARADAAKELAVVLLKEAASKAA